MLKKDLAEEGTCYLGEGGVSINEFININFLVLFFNFRSESK